MTELERQVRGLEIAVRAIRAGAEECRRADRWFVRASDDLAQTGRAAARACQRLGNRLLQLARDYKRIANVLDRLSKR